MNNAPFSFASAKTLDIYIDKLPRAGPPWKSVEISPTTGTPNKDTPPTLYYRDPVEVLQYLLSNSALQEGISWAPRRIYQDEEKTKRLRSDFSTGDWWWDIQVCTAYLCLCLVIGLTSI